MKVIYFYHIPKTAGTFISANLKTISSHLPNSKFVSFYDPNWNNMKSNKNKIKEFIPTIKGMSCDYLFITHHHGYSGLKDIHSHVKNIDNLFFFTCLREIESFTTSVVNYGKKINGRYQSFQFMIDHKDCHNMQAKYLLYNHFAAWDADDVFIDKDILNNVLKSFSKIYTKNISDLKKDLLNFLGSPIVWSDTKINTTSHIDLMTKSQKSKIIANNKIDIWIYNNATTFTS